MVNLTHYSVRPAPAASRSPRHRSLITRRRALLAAPGAVARTFAPHVLRIFCGDCAILKALYDCSG